VQWWWMMCGVMMDRLMNGRLGWLYCVLMIDDVVLWFISGVVMKTKIWYIHTDDHWSEYYHAVL